MNDFPLFSFTGCDCDQFGANRTDCHQDNGKCLCKDGVKGHHCDICEADDFKVSFDVCGMKGVKKNRNWINQKGWTETLW